MEISPLDDDPLLLPHPAEFESSRLQADILNRTLRTMQHRRWLRRGVRLAGFLFCFLAGILCMSLFRSERLETPIVVLFLPKMELPEEKDPEPGIALKKRPAQLELEAEQLLARAESARIFRQAGDAYLLDESNYRAALRCYRNFLDEADVADLTPSKEDTWLLTSLKADRLEKENEQ